MSPLIVPFLLLLAGFTFPRTTGRLLRWLARGFRKDPRERAERGAAPRTVARFPKQHGNWTAMPGHVQSLPFASAWTPDDCVWLERDVWHLDLHGLDVRGAEMAVVAFVDDARRLGLQRCRVITGKGNNSDGPPRLLVHVPVVLQQLRQQRHVRGWEAEPGSYLVTLAGDRR